MNILWSDNNETKTSKLLLQQQQLKKQTFRQWHVNLTNKLVDQLKRKSFQSTFIDKVQRKIEGANASANIVIQLRSIYYSLFSIDMTIRVQQLFNQIKIIVQYTISAINFSLGQYFPMLENLKWGMKQIQRDFPYTKTATDVSDDGLKIKQINQFHFDLGLMNVIVERATSRVYQAYELCNAVIGDLQYRLFCSNLMTGKQNKSPQLDVYKGLGLVQQENNKFRYVYKNENNGVSFLASPEEIQQKNLADNNQVLREIQVNKIISRKRINPQDPNKSQFKCGYSQHYFVKVFGTRLNTFFNHKEMKNNEEKDFQYKPGLQEGMYYLIGKQASQNEDAVKSLKNELLYLRKKGTAPCPYICKYYMLREKQGSEWEKGSERQKTVESNNSNNNNNKNDKNNNNNNNSSNNNTSHQQQIHSQYHEQTAFKKFHTGQSFTLLDIVNFIEQTMLGLLSFYLNLGYLNRDVKEENILINLKKMIQIIDHGSVYPYRGDVVNPLLEEERRMFDQKVRSTLFCNKKKFQEDQHLVAKYKIFKMYNHLNATHKTFDVYSVGCMLKEILEIYQHNNRLNWIEVSQKFKVLIQKMMMKDFQYRIKMEDALAELQSIRKFIFGRQISNQQK